MAARRLIFVLLILLMISSFAAALVPVERNARERESSSTTTETTDSTPRGALVVREIEAGKEPQAVRIVLGDQLQLAVAADVLDQVEIPALGELEAVEPDSPAEFDLLPEEAGSYAIRLVDANRLIGSIDVVGGAATKQSKKPGR